MSSRHSTRRTVLALLAPLATAALVATAAPANAIPMEGMSGGCVQLVDRDAVGNAGSPLFISFGYALVLGDC
jgi:hypothetical protein